MQNIDILEAFEYKPNEFWVIKTRDLATPGKYEISMDFSGSLTWGIVGFYYSQYINEAGETRYLILL